MVCCACGALRDEKAPEPAPLEFTFAAPDSLPLPAHIDLPHDDEGNSSAHSPDNLLRLLNKDKEANLDLAYKIAINIRKPDYSLRAYHNDLVAAFPELTYYMINGSKVSSGGTPEDEYKRARAPMTQRSPRTVLTRTAARPHLLVWPSRSAGTIGAAFAVYWLMRVGIDGERGFCFGVDEAWKPNLAPLGHPLPEGNFFSMSPAQRRLAFYYKAPWGAQRTHRCSHHFAL